jgi:hypothetical protein
MLSSVIQPGTKFVLIQEKDKFVELEYLRMEWGIFEESGCYAYVIVTLQNDKEIFTPIWMWEELISMKNIVSKELFDLKKTFCISRWEASQASQLIVP